LGTCISIGKEIKTTLVKREEFQPLLSYSNKSDVLFHTKQKVQEANNFGVLYLAHEVILQTMDDSKEPWKSVHL